MSTNQPTTTPGDGQRKLDPCAGRNTPEYRAAVVAGIRALADLIERNLDVPVPNSVRAQHSILSGTAQDKTDLVSQTAAVLAVDADIDGNGATGRLNVAQGGHPTPLSWFSVEYVIHGNLHDKAGEQA
jgi:hypothetical protein